MYIYICHLTLILALTRRPARIGSGGGMHIFGRNRIPSRTIGDTSVKIVNTATPAATRVQLRPTVDGIVATLPARFERGMLIFPTCCGVTDPIKRIRRGKTGSTLVCGHDEALGGGGGRAAIVLLRLEAIEGKVIRTRSLLQQERATSHDQHHTSNNSHPAPGPHGCHHHPLQTGTHGRRR